MVAAMRVWDLPTRIFHWMLVFLFAFSWWSADQHAMEWHYRSGLTLMGLLSFRLIWGFIGGSTARFANFIRHPRQLFRYVRGNRVHEAGHNPVGGYSVLAMLGLLFVQIGTGLFATDIDGLESGPLSYFVDFDTGRLIAKIHSGSFNLLLALIGLHIMAIIFYAIVPKRDLVRPMITGRDNRFDGAAGGLVPAGRGGLLFAVVVALFLTWWVSTGLKI